MRILVTGETGVIGRPTVDRFVDRGHTVRLLSREAERDAGPCPAGVEAHGGSVTDSARIVGAADQCDGVVHIAGIVAEHPPESTFESVNVEGTRRLLEEGRRAGPRFVCEQLSGMIRFHAHEPIHEEEGHRTLRFEIRSYFGASKLADGAVMATVGQPLQDVTWGSMVEKVVRRSGGKAVEGAQSDQRALSGEEAVHVEGWVEELVQRRQRAPAHP